MYASRIFDKYIKQVVKISSRLLNSNEFVVPIPINIAVAQCNELKYLSFIVSYDNPTLYNHESS